MRVLVFGASGSTGGLVLDRALGKGHEVSVLVRDASRIKHGGVAVFTGDATDAGAVLNAMKGQDAVIDTIGGTTPYKKTLLERSAVRSIIEAMRVEGARRLIVVSMMGLGESAGQAPFWYRHLLMPTFLRGSTEDKRALESEVRASGLEYVIARPPLLTNDAPSGRIQVLGVGATGHKITRADLATFLVDQLESDEHLRQAVTVVNAA